MIIMGCDFHARSQQIAMLDTETGELVSFRRSESAATEASDPCLTSWFVLASGAKWTASWFSEPP